MGFFKTKGLALAAGLIITGASVHAQQLAPLGPNDVRIVFEQTVEELKAKIENSKNLSEEERIKLSKSVEADADKLRAELTSVVSEAAKLGETTYVAGLILSYDGELNLPTSFFPRLAVAPGAELGIAVFLRDNSYVADSFSGAVAVMGSGSAKLSPSQSQVKQTQKALRLKVLIAANSDKNPIVRLADFSGAYVGLGGEMNLFGRSLSAHVYTRPTTCVNADPLSCSVYMVSISSASDLAQTTPVEAAAKALYLDFPYAYGDRK